MFKEFKDFVMRSNVLDLAIAVIIGGAFGKIVSSLVNDIIMPVIGLVTGGVNFKDRTLPVNGTTTVITWGIFVQTIIDFLIIALVIFIMVRMVSKMQKPADVTTKECQYCAMKISLKATRCPHCTAQLS